jgi:hypothetical protein
MFSKPSGRAETASHQAIRSGVDVKREMPSAFSLRPSRSRSRLAKRRRKGVLELRDSVSVRGKQDSEGVGGRSYRVQLGLGRAT